MPAKMFEGKIPTPNGLQELMFGFTKEIIKNQPENIIEFAAEHFEKLLLLREEARRVERVKKIPKKTLKMEKEDAVGEADDDTEPILTEIEHETCEKIITNKSLETSNNVSKYDRTVAAVVLIQKSFRSYKQRQLGNLQKPSVCDELPHQRGLMETYDTTDSDETSTFSSAATKIQANVRGYLVRKSLAKNTSDATIAPSMSLDEGDNLKDIVEEKENLVLESGKVFEGEHDVYVDSIRSDNLEKINEEIETKSDDNIVDKNSMNKENIELEVDSVSQNTVSELTEDTENMLEDVEINNTQVNDIENGEIEISDQNKNINDEHKINMDDLSNDVKNIQQVVSADENKIIDADKNDDDENQENADVSNINSSNLEQLNMSSGGNINVDEGENVGNSDVNKNHSNTSNSSIDLSDKNVEDAAVTIQHSYRVYRSRTLRREDAVQSTTSSEGTSVAVNDKGDKEISDDEDGENYVLRDYVAGDSKQGSEEKKTSSKENKSTTQNAEGNDASVTRDNVAKSSATLVPGTALNNITEEDEEADLINNSATRDYVADNAIQSSGNAPNAEEDSIIEIKKITLENVNTAENQESNEKNAQLLDNTDSELVDENQAKHVENIENDSEKKTNEIEISNTENVDDETGVESVKDSVEIDVIKNEDNDSDDEELTGGKSFISRDYVSLENKEVIPIEEEVKSETNHLKEDESNKIKDNVDNNNENETIKNSYISTEPQTSGSFDDKMNDVVSAAVESNQHSIRKRSAVSEIIHGENNEEKLQEHGEEAGKEEDIPDSKDVRINSEQIEVTDDGNENETVTEVNIAENQNQENDDDDTDDEVLKGGKIQINRDYIGAGNVSSKNAEELNVEDILEGNKVDPLETQSKVENDNLVKDDDKDIIVDKNENLNLTDSVEEIKKQETHNEDTDEEVLTGSKLQVNRDYVGAASVDLENTSKGDVEDILEEKKLNPLGTESEVKSDVPLVDNEKDIEIDKNENLKLIESAEEIKNQGTDNEDTDDEVLTGSKIQVNRDYASTGSVEMENTANVDVGDILEEKNIKPLKTEPNIENETSVIEDDKDIEMDKNEDFADDAAEIKKQETDNEDTDDEVLTGSKKQVNRDYIGAGSVEMENTTKVDVEDILEEKKLDSLETELKAESEISAIDNEKDKEMGKNENFMMTDSAEEIRNQGTDNEESDDEVLTGSKMQVNRDYISAGKGDTENTTKVDVEDILEEKKINPLKTEPKMENEIPVIEDEKDVEIDQNENVIDAAAKIKERETDNEDTDDEVLTGSKIQVNRNYVGSASADIENTGKVDVEDISKKEKETPLETESEANRELIDDKEDGDEDADDEVFATNKIQINGDHMDVNNATVEKKVLSLPGSVVDSSNENRNLNNDVDLKQDLTEETVKENEKQEIDNKDTDDEVLTGSKVQASRDYLSGSRDVDKDGNVVMKEDLIKQSIEENNNEETNDKVSDNEILTGDKLQVNKDYLGVTDDSSENTTTFKGEDTLEKKELSLIDGQPQFDSESHNVGKDEDANIDDNEDTDHFEEDIKEDTDNKDSDDEILTGSKIQVNRDYSGVTDTNTENKPKDDTEDILENKYLSSPENKAASEIDNEESNTNILLGLNHNNQSSTTVDASQNKLKESNDELTDNAARESNDGELNGDSIKLSEDYIGKELAEEDNSIKAKKLELVNSENASNLESVGDEECNETKAIRDGKENLGQNDNSHATKNNEESSSLEEIDTKSNDTESKDSVNETENLENKDESNTHIKEPLLGENKEISNEDTVKKASEVNEPIQAMNIVKQNYESEVQETVENKVKVDENDNETNEVNESDDEELKGGKTEVNRDYVAVVSKDVPIVGNKEGDKTNVEIELENKTNTITEEENSKSDVDVDANRKEDESKMDNNVVHIKSEENPEVRSSAVDEDNNNKECINLEHIEANNGTSEDDNIVKDSHVKDDKDEEELYGGHQNLQRDYIAPLLTTTSANINSMLPETTNNTKENIVENSQESHLSSMENHVDEKQTSDTDVENQGSENSLLENDMDENHIVNVNRNNLSDIENLEDRIIHPHGTVTNPNHIENNDVVNPGNEIETMKNHEITENIPHEDSVTNNLTYTNRLHKDEIFEDNYDHDNDETENLFSLDSLNENPVKENSINEDDLQDERHTSFSNDLGDGTNEDENHSHENLEKKTREQNDSDEEELTGGHSYVNRDYVVTKPVTANSSEGIDRKDEERLKDVEDQIEKDNDEAKVPSSNEKNKMNFKEDGILENKENENTSKEEIIENSKDKVANDYKNVDVLSPTSEEKQNSIESILKRDYFAKLGTLKKSLSDTSDKMSKNIEINDEKMIIKSINSEIENKIVNLTDKKNLKGESVRSELKDSADKEKECAEATTQDLSHENGMTSPQRSGSAQASDLTEETSTPGPTPTPPPPQRISRETAETSMNELNAVSAKQTDVDDSSENKSATKLTQNSETFVEAAKDFGENQVNTQEQSATKENSVDLLQESAKIDPKISPADQADQKLEQGLQKAEKIGQKVSEIDQNFTNLIDSDSQEDMNSKENAAAKIQAGFRGYRVRKQMRRDQELVTDQYKKPLKRNGSLEERSATKIQAGIRGFLVRRKHNKAKEAATKIQASFRGFKTRKAMKKNGEV